MANLVEQYTEDRTLTKTMVEATFRRDEVPEELLSKYFECYDEETAIGLQIAEWLDNNRTEKENTEDVT